MEKITYLIRRYKGDPILVADAIEKQIYSNSGNVGSLEEVARELFYEVEMPERLSDALEAVTPEQMADAAYAWLDEYVDNLRGSDTDARFMGVSDADIWNAAWYAGVKFGQYLDAELDITLRNLHKGLEVAIKKNMVENISEMVG